MKTETPLKSLYLPLRLRFINDQIIEDEAIYHP